MQPFQVIVITMKMDLILFAIKIRVDLRIPEEGSFIIIFF